VITSATFARSPQAAKFLVFVVEEVLARRGDEIKAFKIGVQALGISGPRSDPDGGARMQASRTRKLLASYYMGPGRGDQVRIVLPTGSYQPCFELVATDQEVAQLPARTIVVLPFVIHADADEWRSLGDFFAQELASALQRFDGVVVRTQACAGDSSELTLNTHVQVRADSVRTVVALRDGSGACLWHDRMQTSTGDVDTMRFGERIANRVAPALVDATLGIAFRQNLPLAHRCRDPLGNARFRDYVISGSLEALKGSVRLLESAVLRNPMDLVQRTVLAHANAAMYALGADNRQEFLDVAEEQVRQVLALAPDSAHARFVKGFVHFHRREGEAARHELRLSVRCNPLQMHTVGGAGLLLALMGEWQEGLTLIDSVYSMFPNAPGFFHLAHCAYHFFENGEAEEAYRRSELFDTPELAWAPLLRAVCLAVLGRRYEASRAISELLTLVPDFNRHARTYLSGYLYAESLVEAFASALREAGLKIGPAQGRPSTRGALTVTAAAADNSEVRIGILHSLSGTMAICERHLAQAARFAVDEVNAAGGVLGRHVTAVVEDGASNPLGFSNKAHKLITQDEVVGIFGCWTSACRKAVRPIVEHHNLLLWYPVQYEGLERSRNIIYTGSCLNQQIEPATRWAIAQGKRRFFLVGSDYVFPRTANYLIRALVEGAGGEVIGEEYRPLGAGGFREVVERIKRVAPDLVFNTINGSDNLEFFRELANAGLNADQCPVMSFSLSELELPDLKGGASGHFACWGYFQSVDVPENRELLRRFRERYGEHEVLSDPAVTAYAQIHLWKQVAETANSFDTDTMLRAIVGSELSLGGDTLEVRSNNHVKRRALIGRIRPDNQFDVVWGSHEAIAPKPWLGVEESNLDSQALLLETLGGVPEMMNQKAELEREIAQHLPVAHSNARRSRSDFPPAR
jgi:urea ABC transporter urea binding protein